jgi:phosphorylcholine metabolism protein LicD
MVLLTDKKVILGKKLEILCRLVKILIQIFVSNHFPQGKFTFEFLQLRRTIFTFLARKQIFEKADQKIKSFF